MSCPICKTECKQPADCATALIVAHDYPNNTVLTDALKDPDVLKFLYRCTECQLANPARFSPIPAWFQNKVAKDAKDFKDAKLIDMKRFERACTLIKIDSLIVQYRECANDAEILKTMDLDVYMLLRFIIMSCPFKMSHTALVHNKEHFDQYKITHSAEKEAAFLKGKEGKISYLYHGSPMSNWHSITRNGLKVMSGTSFMTTGAVYGDGIYLSDLLDRSYSYSINRNTRAIIVGVYEVYNSTDYQANADIHVVPKDDLLLLRYLIYVANPQSINALGAALKVEWDKKAANKGVQMDAQRKKAQARIIKEIKAIEAVGKVETKDDMTYMATINDVKFEIEFTIEFPFQPPIVKRAGTAKPVKGWKPNMSVLAILTD